jgi:mono/diheme cytochrome c family protein
VSKTVFWGIAILTLALAGTSFGQSKLDAQPTGNIARGKYLVNNIATCGDCHTPTDKKGQPIRKQHLQGSVLMFKPLVEVPGWMEAAPGIAGLNWTDEQSITFFMTGKRPNGTVAAPPMPQLRMNKADAAAVTAYLKSLKP